LTRRSFLKAALAAGGAAALPALPLAKEVIGRLGLAGSSGLAPLPGGPFFLLRSYLSPSDGATQDHDLWGTAEAICARIIPTDIDALTGRVLSPGATEAGAVNFIDLFLAAFQGVAPSSLATAFGQKPLPSSLVTNPPIYLAGRYSGRYPQGDPTTGQPSMTPVADDFESSSSGPFQFLGLTPAQTMSWYLRLYGNLAGFPVPSWADQTTTGWRSQVSNGTIPGPVALRGHVDPSNSSAYVEGLYEQGLVAFDDWTRQNFQQPFAKASTTQQDALLLLASNPLLGAASASGFPGLPAPLPNPVPPPAAANLFGVIALHTIQGTYGLPEYAGSSDLTVNGSGQEPNTGTIWASIGWDGDTAPLGNSIYQYGSVDAGYTPGQSTYTDAAGKVQPQGSYFEYRPVSTPGDGDGQLATATVIGEVFAELSKAGVLTVTRGGTL
jgi:hypothetical protein